MARPRKMISLEEQIKKQEETVLKVKEKYDSEMMKLKDLYAKRNEEKKKELLKAVEEKNQRKFGRKLQREFIDKRDKRTYDDGV